MGNLSLFIYRRLSRIGRGAEGTAAPQRACAYRRVVTPLEGLRKGRAPRGTRSSLEKAGTLDGRWRRSARVAGCSCANYGYIRSKSGNKRATIR